MNHLTFEQISTLADAASMDEGFDAEQINQLEHLKTCNACYSDFCLLCSLNDVLSECGSFVQNYTLEKNPSEEFSEEEIQEDSSEFLHN